jgi:hypothetical protein
LLEVRQRSIALCIFENERVELGVLEEAELEGEGYADEESFDDADFVGLC